MKVFLDTNVLVSAFTTRGLCADVFRLVLSEHELVTGEVICAELRQVLSERFGLSAELISGFLALLHEHPVVPRPEAPAPAEIRDPDDAWVLASARAAGADVLVTGDRDLLALAGKADIRIANPREIWTSLQSGS